MAETAGTGRHPHKSTEEPWPHHEGQQGSGSSREVHRSESRDGERSESRSARSSSEGGPTSETRDLKEREYRDKQGEIHHHTHTSEAMKE